MKKLQRDDGFILLIIVLLLLIVSAIALAFMRVHNAQ
jgi:Tfp pilus assembly protein PilX